MYLYRHQKFEPMAFEIRRAKSEDMQAVWDLIKELAIYEKAPDELTVTVAELQRDGFGENPQFKVFLGEFDGNLVGIAFYYISYSTWKGTCLYLEDLVVTQTERGKGFGKLLFTAVAEEAKNIGAKRMSWQVLDWNTPAIDFYKHMSAGLDAGWINGRYTAEELQSKF
jgi:GNAT superfamily N-acetyltransferase